MNKENQSKIWNLLQHYAQCQRDMGIVVGKRSIRTIIGGALELDYQLSKKAWEDQHKKIEETKNEISKLVEAIQEILDNE